MSGLAFVVTAESTDTRLETVPIGSVMRASVVIVAMNMMNMIVITTITEQAIIDPVLKSLMMNPIFVRS